MKPKDKRQYFHLLGIDPGIKNTGAAWYTPKDDTIELVPSGLAACVFRKLMSDPRIKNTIVVIEVPTKPFFATDMLKKGIIDEGAALTMAFAIGKQAGIADYWVQYFEMWDIPYITVNPGGRKKAEQKVKDKDKYGKGKQDLTFRLGVPELIRCKATKAKPYELKSVCRALNITPNNTGSEHSRDGAFLLFQYHKAMKAARKDAGLPPLIKPFSKIKS